MLVKPAESWSDDAWDPDAEALHGLSRRKLERAGQDPAAVCKVMNNVLGDAAVFSDAPDWDGFWLYRLFEAARVRQSFKLLNFADLFENIPVEQFRAAKTQAEKKAPHRHRARPDVLHMRVLYGLTVAGNGS